MKYLDLRRLEVTHFKSNECYQHLHANSTQGKSHLSLRYGSKPSYLVNDSFSGWRVSNIWSFLYQIIRVGVNKDHVSMVLPANRYMRPTVLCAIVSLDITEYSVTKKVGGCPMWWYNAYQYSDMFSSCQLLCCLYLWTRMLFSELQRHTQRKRSRVPPNRSRSYNLLILVLRTHFPWAIEGSW